MNCLNFIKIFFSKGKLCILSILFLLNAGATFSQKYDLPSIRYKNQKLEYLPDSLGNQIPDYSYCGYNLSETPIPFVPVKVVVPPKTNDATSDIQNAIDYVSGLPIQENGFRGAVLLQTGIYKVSGRLKITVSGIVLRGSGEKTVLIAAGKDRETLIRVIGVKDFRTLKTAKITDDFVPVNSAKFEVENGTAFQTGESVFIHRPSTKEWINKLGMEEFGGETGWLGWKPGQRDIVWELQIKNISGNTITLNSPLTVSLDSKYGGGEISSFSWPGRISNIGIENLTLESEFDAKNLKDEAHCWFAITMENCKNAWVRQVKFNHFAGSAVALYETASRITVEDCISVDPVSEIAGQRRNTFFTMGQQTLFLRCYAENGNHDFSTGFCAAGPNAFVQCESVSPHNFSGAIDSWASGVLFDIVNIDGQALSFTNRGQDGQGAGWTAANSMFWQCTAGRIECFSPPTAQNFAYGAWAQFAGDGLWYEANSQISPRSLFFAQLAERLDKDLIDFENQILPFSGESTSSPTIEQATEFSGQSVDPPVQLEDFIQNASKRNPITIVANGAISNSQIKTEKESQKTDVKPVLIKNGHLIQNGKILKGNRLEVPWWRGDPRPFSAEKASPAITRFVPGRVGNGYTDDLTEVVNYMVDKNIVALDHNYGLWYDRRRDDHERVKRFDSESWAPFYEQPFARSGQGDAWDRLSKYDLSKYNPWYWNRLAEFAKQAAEPGKLLIHQNYFQHNILEAGAHWADSPWRPANNINNTGFPEPPPYSGDKRIYMAEQFYDISNPVRRELHRAYIRKCLDNFANQANVIQSISAEFTGPLHFVEFWLDVISEWEKETGNNALVALCTTKDVQDTILADPLRSKIVDIIDIRYWAYREDGTLYAPPGGVHLAPRQHARKIAPGKRSFEQVYRSVSEYRSKFPGKAVIYSEGNFTDFSWAVFMAGGSLPAFNFSLPDNFLIAASEMVPAENINDNKNDMRLENKGNGQIIFSKSNEKIEVDLHGYKGKFNVSFLNPKTGKFFEKQEIIEGEKTQKIETPFSGDVVIWINKNK
jgi:hypothetical protein